MDDILTRGKARQNNLPFYFTGEFCENGHLSERFTISGKCKECSAEEKQMFMDDIKAENAQKKIAVKDRKEARKQAKVQELSMYLEDPEYLFPVEPASEEELSTLPPSKEEALQLGNKYYYSGELCKHGHLDKRNLRGVCHSCYRANVRKQRILYPEKNRSRSANRRSLVFANGGRHTAKDIRKLFDEQDGVCNTCGACLLENSYHIDHILPVILGGRNSKENLQLLCPTCNLRKGSLRPHEWELKFLAEQIEKEEV